MPLGSTVYASILRPDLSSTLSLDIRVDTNRVQRTHQVTESSANIKVTEPITLVSDFDQNSRLHVETQNTKLYRRGFARCTVFLKAVNVVREREVTPEYI